MRRRSLLAAPALLPAFAAAQSWQPARAMRMMVPFPPGGTTDLLARMVAERLGARLGQAVIVENRPGAGGNLGGEAALAAEPDGHTLFMTTVSASAVMPPHMDPPPFDVHGDQTAIVLAATVPLVVVVPNSSPARDLHGLVELSRATPGGLNEQVRTFVRAHGVHELVGTALDDVARRVAATSR